MSSRKVKKEKEKGLRRIDKELEIDQFLKQQIKMKIAIKALFSKIERFLIRNNKKFVIQTDSSDSESSSVIAQSEIKQELEFESKSKNSRFQQLLA